MAAERVFLDSNIVLYLLSTDEDKARETEAVIGAGAIISVQVLNEVSNVMLRKLKLNWIEASDFLDMIKAICTIVPVTLSVHERGCILAQRYGFNLYDAMIVSAALESHCVKLFSEDMHSGLHVEKTLRIVNPYK